MLAILCCFARIKDFVKNTPFFNSSIIPSDLKYNSAGQLCKPSTGVYKASDVQVRSTIC